MNAACSVAKTLDDISALSKTKIGVVTIGSITLEPRDGNPEPRWFTSDIYALNSFGMPNQGGDFYKKQLPEMVRTIHGGSKKASLSIAGFSTKEYVELAKIADAAKVDLLELNLGCPNVSIDGKQKPIASFDPATIHEIVTAVSEVTKIPLLVKLSPYSNPAELQNVAKTIVDSGKVSGVVASNTFPNGFMSGTNGQPVVASIFAGVSGRAMLPISLGQVRQFRQTLPKNIVVIGVGGIESKEDVERYKQAGAGAVQTATLIVRDGHAAIDRLVA